MKTTVKIINSIRAKALQRRLFRLFLEVDAIYGDLPLHCGTGWLSKGLILTRFRELLSHVKEFSKENNKHWHFLENPDWLLNLAFLTDITTKLNELFLELQGKNKYIIDMISSINAFIMKLEIWIFQIRKENFTHFPNIEDEFTKQQTDKNHYLNEFATVLENIMNEFKHRFSDFKKITCRGDEWSDWARGEEDSLGHWEAHWEAEQ